MILAFFLLGLVFKRYPVRLGLRDGLVGRHKLRRPWTASGNVVHEQEFVGEVPLELLLAEGCGQVWRLLRGQVL